MQLNGWHVPLDGSSVAGESFLSRHAIDAGTFLLDFAAGRFYPSPRWAAMLGCELPTMRQDPGEWFDRVHPEDRTRLQLELLTHVEGLSEVFEAEYRMKHNDGSYRWVRARGRVERNGNGTAERLVGHQVDITEPVGLQERLRRSESRFRTLIESCPDAVAVHRNGRFIYVNRALLALLGYERDAELVGRAILEAVYADDISGVAELMRALAAGAVQSQPFSEVRLVARDGTVLTTEVSSLLLSYDDEPAIYTVARDVTDRKRMQARLAHTDRMANLGTLAAGVAHEINNPLTYVSVNLQSLVEDLPLLATQAQALRDALVRTLGGDRAASLLGHAATLLDAGTYDDMLQRAHDAHQGSLRMQAIVSDLKNFTRDDQETRSRVDLPQVARAALKMARHEIKFRARIVEDLQEVPRVLADEGRLCQVFLNLLVNAAHAIEAGGCDDNEIRVRVFARGDQVIAEVEDTGCGIPAENVGRIFDPFFTTKPPGVGSGLGLPICQHIVESLGGRIEVQTEVGRRTVFRLRLPALAQIPEPVALLPTAEEDRPEPLPAAPRARLLVIDDEPTLCRVLQRELGRDYEVVTAGGGSEALSLLGQDQRFDLILCDLMMADVSGQDVFEWISSRLPGLRERVVFITGGAVTARAQAFLDSADNLIVDKPVDMRNLRRLIRRLARPEAPAAVPVPPETAAPGERRRAPRFGDLDLTCLLETPDRVLRAKVVGWSAVGLRVASVDASGHVPTGTEVTLVLRRDQPPGVVQARAQLVRRAPTAEGTDLCFELGEMDEASMSTWREWLCAAAGRHAAPPLLSPQSPS